MSLSTSVVKANDNSKQMIESKAAFRDELTDLSSCPPLMSSTALNENVQKHQLNKSLFSGKAKGKINSLLLSGFVGDKAGANNGVYDPIFDDDNRGVIRYVKRGNPKGRLLEFNVELRQWQIKSPIHEGTSYAAAFFQLQENDEIQYLEEYCEPLLWRALESDGSYLEEKAVSISIHDQFSFFAIGDFGEPVDKIRDTAHEMAKFAKISSPTFILGLGDNIYPWGCESADDALFHTNWADVFIHPYEDLRIPWKITLGNHDYYTNPFAEVFSFICQLNSSL
jgi:hypothetical protein